MPLADRTLLVPRLSQGSVPYPGEDPAAAGFDVVAICAEEIADSPAYAPSRSFWPDAVRVYAGIDDGDLTRQEISLIEETARDLAFRHARGDGILTTCAQGRNRSGLCSALVLVHRFGWTGEQALLWVQTHRANALRNPSFQRYLLGR